MKKPDSVEDGATTSRAMVIGGWIVADTVGWRENDADQTATAMVFIPDPDHIWEIKRSKEATP